MSGFQDSNSTTQNDRMEVVITDESTGDYAQVVTRDDLIKALATATQIIGRDGVHSADVFLEGGVRKLQTNATATVESLFGEAVFPFTAIKILALGSTGDTIKIEIPDDSVSVTTTQNVADTTLNDLVKRIADDLNADGTFNSLYEASVPRDSNIVCIEALLVQTLRSDSGDVVVTTPIGSISFSLIWDTIKDQSLALALFPHPRDCTKGTINVTGLVSVIESGRPPKRILLHDSGGSPDMGIDGTTPVEFRLTNNTAFDTTQDFIVTELRIEATVNTLSNTFDKYVGIPALTNGHRVQIRSGGSLDYDELLKRVPDIFHSFVIGTGSKFDDKTGSGDDSLVAVFARPFIISKADSFLIDDDIVVTVQDDMSASAIKRLQMSVVGFFEDQL